MRFLRLLAAFVFCLPVFSLPALAQRQSVPEPQIQADGSVTFRLLAPGATAASVSIEGTREPLPMHAAGTPGTWTLTTDPLPPENYSYHFNVDGRTVLDAQNPQVKASYTGIGNSFLIPGSPAQPWETTAVPHGTVHHHTFTTHVVEGLPAAQDEFYVYTPPGYDARAKTRYPVLYLLHGWSDTAGGWSSIGHANDILDNLIATGKARPMIVVMPLGYGYMGFVQSGSSVWDDPANIDHNTDVFARSLLTEVLPQVESTYNVAPGRENRAITGLSMGGLESISVGLNNAAQFAWVGGFSAAVQHLKPESLAAQPKSANLRLLWIACGTSDQLSEPNSVLVAALMARGFPVTAIRTAGAHTWLVWRDNLIHFVPLLFQPK